MGHMVGEVLAEAGGGEDIVTHGVGRGIRGGQQVKACSGHGKRVSAMAGGIRRRRLSSDTGWRAEARRVSQM
ncbi:hypothetical protein HPA02_09850 [Bisbaumannia pacifica]|uniref:Uncharacterized protein n=1 Tax=Bisbaumannia pacifica TaxID=77098 RepID=A0A510X5J5_9GAMM|nr:hypothetical protein HPA02_09850 [Halomonas pacifica]